MLIYLIGRRTTLAVLSPKLALSAKKNFFPDLVTNATHRLVIRNIL